MLHVIFRGIYQVGEVNNTLYSTTDDIYIKFYFRYINLKRKEATSVFNCLCAPNSLKIDIS